MLATTTKVVNVVVINNVLVNCLQRFKPLADKNYLSNFL